VHSPMDGGPLSVLLVLAAGAVNGMPQSLLTGRMGSSPAAEVCDKGNVKGLQTRNQRLKRKNQRKGSPVERLVRTSSSSGFEMFAIPDLVLSYSP
jgi:hypothetical protein